MSIVFRTLQCIAAAQNVPSSLTKDCVFDLMASMIVSNIISKPLDTDGLTEKLFLMIRNGFNGMDIEGVNMLMEAVNELSHDHKLVFLENFAEKCRTWLMARSEYESQKWGAFHETRH